MTHKKPPINANDKLWISTRGVLFASAVLIPFFFKVESPCPQPQTLSELCTEEHLQLLGSSWQTSLPGWLAALALIVTTVVYWKTSGRKSTMFAKLQLNINIAVAVVITIAFFTARQFSQASSLGSYTIADDNTVISVSEPIFGLSISPSTYLLLIALFLASPIYIWLTINKGKHANTGVKNSELFE